jgi:2-haloalkanoic acid dehalogenase type II
VSESPGRFKALSFDCYGTLIDWETGIWNSFQPVIEANPGVEISRSGLLAQYGDIESAAELARPNAGYREILRIVHRDLAERLGMITNDTLDQGFSESVGNWPAFPDSREALNALGERFNLVILSNVDRASFAASEQRLGVEFDAVYTAEDIGTYKPDPANFAYLIEHVRDDFGIGLQEMLHVAQSLYHDHVPAIAAGLTTTWIDRQRLSEGGDWGATAVVEAQPEPAMKFFTMGEMASALGS